MHSGKEKGALVSEGAFVTEQKRGKEGGGLGAENWGLWVSAPRCLAVGDLLREFPHPALREVRLVVLALAFHRDSLLERRRLPTR